jgi:hypothetical protein
MMTTTNQPKKLIEKKKRKKEKEKEKEKGSQIRNQP